MTFYVLQFHCYTSIAIALGSALAAVWLSVWKLLHLSFRYPLGHGGAPIATCVSASCRLTGHHLEGQYLHLVGSRK